MSSAAEPIIRVVDLVKRFGGVTALDGVSMHLLQGEALGLIGDNGAGKSTLMKILCGYYGPDSGQLYFKGESVALRSVSHARRLGIEAVYQDLALVNELSVYQNLFLNREFITLLPLPGLDKRRMRTVARQRLADMRINIPDVNAKVGVLSGGQRQAIAVARAVYSDARVVLLDEPLAAMGAKEGALVLDLIDELKTQGVSMIIVAHNYAHVLDVCDRVILFDNGRVILDKPARETSVEELTDLVVAEYRVARSRNRRA